MKKRRYHQVMTVLSKSGTDFIEAGWVEHPNRYKDNVYLDVKGHNITEMRVMRVDEALIIIQVLSAAVNKVVNKLDIKMVVGKGKK